MSLKFQSVIDKVSIALVAIVGAIAAFFLFRGDVISEVECADAGDCAVDVLFEGQQYSAFCEPLPEGVLADLEPFAEGNVFGSDVELFELPDLPLEDGFGAVFTEESPACGGTEGHLYLR